MISRPLTIAAALLFFLQLAACQSKRPRDPKNSLKQLGVYFALYEGKFKKYPPSLDDMARELKVSPDEFKCPHCGSNYVYIPERPGTWSPVPGPPYSWTSNGITEGAPPDLPIALCEHCASTPGKDCEVLFFQGRVDVLASGSPTAIGILELLKRQRQEAGK